ncbi:MAG: hypothetical protein KY460_15885 [Actinobacteria bacterium]|nr:hypothetical protein [Actinomycetota bacterium]
MVYAFIVGPVAITVRYWEEHAPNSQVEAGARVEVRRVTPVIGGHDRPGAAGWRIAPVSDGGIWRADLLELIAGDQHEPRHHYHPDFRDGDVGTRVFDPTLTADPVGWTMDHLAGLPALLVEAGAPELANEIDMAALRRALPAVRTAIVECTGPRDPATAPV